MFYSFSVANIVFDLSRPKGVFLAFTILYTSLLMDSIDIRGVHGVCRKFWRPGTAAYQSPARNESKVSKWSFQVEGGFRNACFLEVESIAQKVVEWVSLFQSRVGESSRLPESPCFINPHSAMSFDDHFEVVGDVRSRFMNFRNLTFSYELRNMLRPEATK